MEKEKFEESWKDAFGKAEISPSEKVWTNIELDLEKARGGELKRRLIFYKMLAAASVVFAMAIGGIGYYYSFRADRGAGTTIAAQTLTTPDVSGSSADETTARSETTAEAGNAAGSAQTTAENPEPENTRNDRKRNSLQEESRSPGQEPVIEHARHDATDRADEQNFMASDEHRRQANTLASRGADEETAYAGLPSRLKERNLPSLYTPREVRLVFPDEKQEVDPVLAMLAKLEQREREVQDEKENRKNNDSNSEKLWTSIGFAAGSFNTVQASPAGPTPSNGSAFLMAAQAAPIVDQETKASGYSYSMGVNVGTRISERWVLQGGVNYLTNSSAYTANNVVMENTGKFAEHRFRAASTNDLINTDETDLNNKLVYTAPYSVNNSMRYLSIPLQAGYLLVNKTFGLQLNAGVATDLFLQNTVDGEGEQLAKTSQPVGSDSPYRAVNLSGLLGTEFSYRFGPHYRVSLNPGIRYPFNTIYKSELGVQSTPLTFDIGLRFRYIFR